MAEERDPLVSRRYRELGSEEPPAELDERILARSRRRRPFQWHGPVAAAAVIVLAVAVTVHVERQQRDNEPVPTSAPSRPAKPTEEARTRQRPKAERREAAPPASPPAAQEAPPQRALEAQRAPAAGAAADSAADGKRAAQSLAKLAEQPPEKWLEGIAELRAQGSHEEADESLKRFRERYPDYQMPEDVKAKVERR